MKSSISILLLTAIWLLTACTMPEPSLPTGADAEVNSEGLVRVKNSRVDDAFMRPDVDFKQFTGILIDGLDLSNVKIVQPDYGATRFNKDWELVDKDRTYLEELFQEKMNKYLFERGGYMRADSPAENVLRLNVAVVKIAPNAPKESDYVGRSTTYSRGAGSISIAGVLYNAGTGQVLARFADTRESQENWGQNNELSNKADVRRIFDFWAQLFQYRLDALNGKI